VNDDVTTCLSSRDLLESILDWHWLGLKPFHAHPRNELRRLTEELLRDARMALRDQQCFLPSVQEVAAAAGAA